MKKIAIVFILSFFSFNSFACSCADWENAKTMLAQYDMAVIAAPISETKFFSQEEWGAVGTTDMKVVTHFKGKYSKFFQLLADIGSGGNCGLKFKKYEGLFLIFGYKYNNKYYASDMCSIGFVTPDNAELAKFIEDLENVN